LIFSQCTGKPFSREFQFVEAFEIPQKSLSVAQEPKTNASAAAVPPELKVRFLPIGAGIDLPSIFL
jgi:hypothetical protein